MGLNALALLAFASAAVSPARAFVEKSGHCDATVKHCVGIELFIVSDDEGIVQSETWLDEQIRHANKLFSSIEVGFEIAAAHILPARWSHLHSREDRDRLGERPRKPGLLSLFVVRHLDDVDVAGAARYGVHWRHRKNRKRRWIIMSHKDKQAVTLAHEIGHYFGLPHGDDDQSIMNKAPRPAPPWPQRVFVESEQERMRKHRDRMFTSGFLRNLARPRVRTLLGQKS